MNEVFFELFSNLPRQGPGDLGTSLRILEQIKSRITINKMVDIGCGTGAVTLELAKNFEGEVYAVDNHRPYLDELEQKAKQMGLSDRIKCLEADMSFLPFRPKTFDLIWSEGAVYIMGFENGLKSWKNYLSSQGYMVLSEICWFKDNPPKEAVDFWAIEVPSMTTIDKLVQLIKRNGYIIEDMIPLATEGWTENFYRHVQVNVNRIREKYRSNSDAMEVIEMTQREIDVYNAFHEYFGYMFFVMRKE